MIFSWLQGSGCICATSVGAFTDIDNRAINWCYNGEWYYLS